MLPKKVIAFITSLFNAILRLSYYPAQWKVAQIIMIPKPGKPFNKASSYCPISLLPILSNIFEKVILLRLNKVELQDHEIIPDHQFGFCEKHLTIEQAYTVRDEIISSLKNKEVCAAVFLDIQQAFDKVWHLGLLYKIKLLPPFQYYLLFQSYLSERKFMVKYEYDNELSQLFDVQAGVPQGSLLGPFLYMIYTADIPMNGETTLCRYFC